MRNRITLLALMLAAPAFAEFTTPEKSEMLRLRAAQSEIAGTFKPLGDSFLSFTTEANRPAYCSALREGVDAGWACHQAMRDLFGSSGETVNRSEVVQMGFSFIDQCRAEILSYATALDAVVATEPRAANLTTVASRLRTAPTLDRFRKDLAYLDPLPPLSPRTVGPHGTYREAQHAIEELSAGSLGAFASATAFYCQVDALPTDGAFTLGLREVIRYSVAPVRLSSAIWSMDNLVLTAQDLNIIASDEASGSGARGTDFFRAILQFERVLGDPHFPTLFSGRAVSAGIIGNFALMLTEFPKAVGSAARANPPEEIGSWYAGPVTGSAPPELARKSTRIVLDFQAQASRAWEAADNVVALWFLLFHGAPPAE